MGSASLWNAEWQTAVRRAMLADVPFTRLTLANGDVTVDKGTGLNLKATLNGRSRDIVVLRTRPKSRDTGTWDEQSFAMKDAELSSTGDWVYETFIPNITEPFDFQWVAGPERSDPYHVDVRFPLQITSMTVSITPPEYTGLPTALQRRWKLECSGRLSREVCD